MLSGISLWQLLIVLVIVIMLFGTKRIRSLGSDLGGAFKGFRDAVKDGEKSLQAEQEDSASLVSSDLDSQKDTMRS
ncbi:MAG TPA: twin-arginine translocase subunit TatA [Alcanivorax sp.]|jgi:sec-independent protein translocase protein TatA|uniref:Sec-independent protein translocase subunit TatA n=1 Tax=Alcanivorax TaxID=59753 RepID=UPI000C5C6B4E|nr:MULTISPECIES: Sec-independent protein translocase subunit TatA [Alcanivorax]MAC14812.1 twin-arginine translocase subunit TatA [Alcanivorax sp.]MBG32805.1 twin-arginine translocase subunit TatA [Alcanivorax sp.]MBP22654.1 twin-arginine translocase subunit TatA [Alcanivorax sp.]HBC19832.1 twin-arginine translocase subunit TatA [Alcanivorax sp.]|tara:strand:+ start:728 stop:955 length:228 start_codon:yes stop_codon:yes gene_type:complete